MTLVLHEHPFAAYCWKALIAFYELRRAASSASSSAAPRIARSWPSCGRSAAFPVLVDGDACWASRAAIVEYVAPALAPGSTRGCGIA